MFLPIMVWELRHAFGQRWFHNLRRLYALMVLAIVVFYYADILFHVSDWQTLRRWTFLWLTEGWRARLLVFQSLAALMLAPILGVVGMMQAKNQRTIELLLTTRQSSLEIVLSHWLAAWLKLLGVLLPGVPLALWLHALLGQPWWSLAVSFVCTAALALPLAAWSLLVAVLFRRTAAAMVAAYVGSAGLCTMVLIVLNDYDLEWIWDPRPLAPVAHVWQTLGMLLAAPTVFCLVVAAWRLRAALTGQKQVDSAKSVQWPRPPVGDEPVFWRDYYLADWLMLRMTRRVPYGVRIGLYFLATFLISLSPAGMLDGTPYCEIVMIAVGFPLIALAWSASAVSSEREMGTWDPLRVTGLRADEFVDQTLRAILPRLYVYWLALLPAVAALACKRRETAPFVPLLWLIGGGGIYPAAVIGLYYSVKSDRAARSILSAISAFTVWVGVYAFIGTIAAGSLLWALSEFLDVPLDFIMYDRRTTPYTTLLMSVIAAWLTRVFLSWTAQYHLNATLVHLAEHEGMPGTDRQEDAKAK